MGQIEAEVDALEATVYDETVADYGDEDDVVIEADDADTGGSDDCTAMDWSRPYEPTNYNVYHAHWAEWSTKEGMPIWFMPGVGNCSGSGAFAMGWMFNEDQGGTGAWYHDEETGSYSLYFNNSPDNARVFSPAESFDWGDEEPEGAKFRTPAGDDFFVWEGPNWTTEEEQWEEDEEEKDTCWATQDMIRGLYNLIDADGDGVVQFAEMESTVQSIGSPEFPEHAKGLFSLADADGDGSVTSKELKEAAKTMRMSGDDAWGLEAILTWCDVEHGNSDDKFQLEEILAGVNDLAGKFSETGLEAIWGYIDMNGDMQFDS